MENELQQTQSFLVKLSDIIHQFIEDNFTSEWLLQVIAKFLLLAVFILVFDFLLKIIVRLVFGFFKNEEKYPIVKALYESRFINSVAHVLTLIVAKFLIEPFFQYRHPESFKFFEMLISIGTVIVLAGMTLRFLKAIEFYFYYKKDYYRIVALRAVSQTIKIFGVFIFFVVIISIIFGISGTTILGSLGAITAVLVLVFRDTILGFVTGLHVATSRNMKAGDWIGIPKYNLEGTIEDINLLTTKILNFDKTVSTIPTYDLLSTEIKNLQVMSETNTRRIKRAIYFDIKSFKFLDEQLYERLSSINLIKDYLGEKRNEILKERENLPNRDKTVNGQQLTNIGTFRVYAFNYLKNHPKVDTKGTLMVRQMEITPHGLPLEIYCFTNDSVWEHYEEIQSDIFDHLLTAAKEFDLEIVQLNFKV